MFSQCDLYHHEKVNN